MKVLTSVFLAIISLFFIQEITAQSGIPSPTVNMTFRSKLGFGRSLANIFGFAANGREYALVGEKEGVTIVDVTNPNSPVIFQQIPGPSSPWREIKMYRNYAYITTEAAGSGLQIVDLSPLMSLARMPATVSVYRGGDSILTEIRNIHALHIDTAKGFAYLFGGNSIITPLDGSPVINTGGVAVVLDIKTNPLSPRYVGRSVGNYIHDGYVRGDTLYAGNIYQGYFSIIDFRDKKNPIVLNTQRTPTAFNHNDWLSDDSKTLFTTDENTGSYLAAYDVSDPYNIKYLDKIRTVAEGTAIVHNTHIINDFAVTSWYTEGVTIVDAHRPQNLIQVAQYDTYTGQGTGFAGCWGVYPYLPSGNLICSNYTDTLTVLTPQYIRACYLEGTMTDAMTGLVLNNVLVKINSSDMDKKATSSLQGIYRTGQVTAGTFTVTYSKSGYYPKILTGVALSNGFVQFRDVALEPIIIPIELVDFNAVIEQNKTRLTWETASEINVAEFKIERLNIENNKEIWATIGTVKATNKPNNYVLFDENPTVGTNYYRLKTIDTDGSFKLSKTISVEFSHAKNAVYLFPNPTKNRVYLSENTLKDGQIVEILDISGKIVLRSTVREGRGGFDIQHLTNGDYFLKIGDLRALKFTKTL
jgi:choice-of-anchor B domain-containing protein